MKEVHTKMEKADGKVKTMCEMCSGEEAQAFCRQCTYFICADCVRSHKKMRVFAAHQVVTLVELKQGDARQIPINEVPPTVCKEHDEPMKIFCFDCNRLICRDCVIDGHTDHKREFIKKYAVQCRSMVTESLTPLRQIQADMKQCTKAIESTEADVSTQHATVSNTIRQSFAKIASVLKQREQQLLDKASEMRDQKLDALGAQKKSLQIVQAESQSLIEFIEHSLEGATDEEVISIYQQILPRVEEESKRHKQISLLPTAGGKLAVEISYNSAGLLKIGRVYDIPTGPTTPLKRDQHNTASSYIFPNGRQLTLKKADIALENVDAIVSSANEDLEQSGGVANALNRVSNGYLQRYSKAYVQREGTISVGDVAVTHGGGALKCKVVIHAVGPDQSFSAPECKQLIAQVIDKSLTEAEKRNFTSIAISAISAGLLGVNKDLVASCVIDSIIGHKFSKAVPVLSDIRIVIIDKATFSCFTRYLNQKKDELLPSGAEV